MAAGNLEIPEKNPFQQTIALVITGNCIFLLRKLLFFFKNNFLPNFLFGLRQEVQAVDSIEEDTLLPEKKNPSFFEKLVVLKNYFFWVLFFTYAVGVGGCLVVLTQMVNIWYVKQTTTITRKTQADFNISLIFHFSSPPFPLQKGCCC